MKLKKMYQTPTCWLPEDQTSEQERDRGNAAPPAEFRDGEESRHLLFAPPGKGGVEESWKSLFTLGDFFVMSLKVCSKFHPLCQTQGCVCLILCCGVWSCLLKDAFWAVCSVLHKVLIRPIPLLKELKEPFSSSSTFLLLLIFCLLSHSFLDVGFYCNAFVICLQQLTPVPTSKGTWFCWILV